MSETIQPAAPTPAQVRRAAEDLKAAIDQHLLAVESRADELDPAVLDAFNALAAAAEEYDELLYAVHDEVTPFEVPAEPPAEYAGPDDIEAFSVFIRRDYLIVDPEALTAAVRAAGESGPGADNGMDAASLDTREAVAELFDAYDADEIAYRAEEIGLESCESTLWVVAGDPELLGGWHDDPFAEADAERLLYRVDVVEEDEEGDVDEVLESDEFDDENDDTTDAAEDEFDGEAPAQV